MIKHEDYLAAQKVVSAYESEHYPIKPKFNPADYVVLNPIGELRHIGENQIAVGVRNSSLMGKSCLMEYEFEGKQYKRQHTDVIPRYLAGEIFSVQIYELVN
jgi:hypothetical protein